MASEAPSDPAPDSAVAAVVAPRERADEIFLEGPNSRFAEFCTLLRVMRDFLRGYRALHFVGPCVTVFGSARIKPDDPNYELALKMGAAIARLGFTVMTGGGPLCPAALFFRSQSAVDKIFLRLRCDARRRRHSRRAL
jgi:hypothetical protein